MATSSTARQRRLQIIAAGCRGCGFCNHVHTNELFKGFHFGITGRVLTRRGVARRAICHRRWRSLRSHHPPSLGCHCERSEAISILIDVDCRVAALLAMTAWAAGTLLGSSLILSSSTPIEDPVLFLFCHSSENWNPGVFPCRSLHSLDPRLREDDTEADAYCNRRRRSLRA